ncbi:MAG: parvulin peptidyl-prolyl isomerase [Ignavibacteriae bacterium HGW-Ignavibacteriae-2]|nr:MAG: parvulin peptidyl-prolyl isomerase [Ignavibacteriae bacterium HGW-Ignavibacteriae-2]
MRFLKIVLFVFLLSTAVIAQEVIDKIVAVVDKEIILQSELDLQVNLESAQRRLDPKDKALRARVLDGMISQKLLYAQAQLDSIEVSDEEVNQQLDYQMNFFIQQYGSREKVEQTYGMSIERIKREFKEDTRKNMMAERVKQKKFGAVEISRKDVDDFYNSYKDSLGLIPEKFTLSHIFLNPKATDKVKNKAYKLAEKLLDSLKRGGDFADLAKKFSDDPGSASQGGDLGTVKRGVFYPQFEAAAYSLTSNEISPIIESPVGFHIIQLLERKGDAIHARHILVKIKNDDDADLKSIEFLQAIRDSILSGNKDFAYYAKKYSDDKETSRFGGELGTFESGQLDKSLLDQVFKLKVGEISFPKRLDVNANTYGFHIVKLVKRTPEHIANMEQDFEDIQRLAQYKKREELYLKWVTELKDKIYWEEKI